MPTPAAQSMAIEKLQAAYSLLMSAVSQGNESAIRDPQEDVRRHLETLAQSAGLKGLLKVDSKWAANIIKQKNQELIGSRIKQLAAKITSWESFQSPTVKQEIGELSGTEVKKLKEIAAAMNHQLTAKKSDAVVVEILEKMTGISSVHIDQALVQSHLQKLTVLHERSVNSLPEAEIKEELKQLKRLPITELARVAQEFGLEKPGKKPGDILKRIETKLKATYKAKMANQV
jgi:hypothetical protein